MKKIGIIGGGVIGICIAIALQKNGFQVCVFDKGKCFLRLQANHLNCFMVVLDT